MKQAIVASLIALLVSAAWAEKPKPPKPYPGEDQFFVKKDTWVETLVASREALSRLEAESAREAAEARRKEPAIRDFQPLRIELAGVDGGKDIRVRVAGLKEVWLGVKSERSFYLGDLRIVDRDGTVRKVTLGEKPTLIHRTNNHWDHDDRESKDPVQIGGRKFARWFRANDAEMMLRLDDKAEFLQATVGLKDEKETRKMLFWVDCVSGVETQKRPTEARQAVWRKTMDAFPGPQVARQLRLEENVWKEEWKTLSDLAARYAAGCYGEDRKRAEALAPQVKDIAGLLAVRDLFYVKPIRGRLDLAQRTLEFVQKSAPRPELAAELDKLASQYEDVRQGKRPAEPLYLAAADLRRRIILSHPALDFPRLLINKRTGFLPEHMCDQYLGRHSQAGPGLVVLDDWKTAPRETALLADKLPQAGVLHPDLSWDGKRVLFAAADHTAQRKGNLRGYYIYELNLETRELRQITGTSADPMEGRNGKQTVLIEDTDPCYLPDGGLAFISTRSQQFGRCHGGRYVPSYTLYRAELDGSRIRPLSYNESNEWGPAVLHDGSIVYTRWDYVNRHDVLFQSLWIIHPDGTQTAHYYGNNSPAPCLIGETQPIPNSYKSVATAAAHHGQTLGTIIVIDPDLGQDHGDPLTWITPEISFPESGVPKNIRKAASPLGEDCGGGRAATPWPLTEDLFLCTYMHGKQYAIYLVDTVGGRELIYSDAKISCFDPIPLRPRPQPPALISSIAGKETSRTGVFYVEDVYQSSQPIPRGSIKSMRINEIIAQPTSSAPVRSRADNEIVKKILGTVPVSADGSVAFEAPANTPFQLQLLDENGMAVMTMRSLVYLQPGEQASCVGCHEPRNSSPPKLRPPSLAIHRIQPPVGPRYEGGFSFGRTVQPVLDRYCVGCHSGAEPPRKIDLAGSYRVDNPDPKARRRGQWTSSYESLTGSGVIKVAPRNGESYPSKVMDYFAHAGKLGKMLLAGHPDKEGRKRVELDRDSLQRIADWLDLNAQFFGDYSFNRIEDLPQPADAEKALRAAVRKRLGQAWADQPFAMLVNLVNPDESRLLLAPLPTAAGGWGQVREGAFRDRSDPAWQEMRQLVQACVPQSQYKDTAGTCGRDNGCRCGVCWVRKEGAARPIPKPVASK